jgi:MFS family permease
LKSKFLKYFFYIYEYIFSKYYKIMNNSTPSNRYSWYVVCVLMIAYISSFIDRQILSLLVIPIKRDLHLSDTQISLLMGLSFALFYTLLGIPIGRLADNKNRKKIIIWGVLAWSFMTTLCGGVRNYLQFFLARIGVGVGEAALSPPAYSIITDYFPKEKLARAISVYSAGIYIGSGLAVLIGAGLIGSLPDGGTTTVPIFGEIFHWQKLFFYIGIPGVLIALLVSTIKEPIRKNSMHSNQANEKLSFTEALKYIKTKQKAFLCVTLGITFISMVAYACTAWIPTYFVRNFGWTVQKAGGLYGIIISIFSTSGIIMGGWLADRFAKQGKTDGKLRVGIIASCGILFTSFFPLLANEKAVIVMLAVPSFFCAFPFGASTAAIQELMPNNVRALASAMYLFVINIVALGFGPLIVALFTDFVFHDEAAIKYSISITACIGSMLALFFYWYGLKYFREAVKN